MNPKMGHASLASMPVKTDGRAGDETRTRDNYLGKVALYQLSYTRNAINW